LRHGALDDSINPGKHRVIEPAATVHSDRVGGHPNRMRRSVPAATPSRSGVIQNSDAQW
jgi:hypothetical protein